jgi:hypothetical protein
MRKKKKDWRFRPCGPHWDKPAKERVDAMTQEIERAMSEFTSTQEARRGEYLTICYALPGVSGFNKLMTGSVEAVVDALEKLDSDPMQILVIFAGILATGVQLGIDIQKNRGANGGPTGTSNHRETDDYRAAADGVAPIPGEGVSRAEGAQPAPGNIVRVLPPEVKRRPAGGVQNPGVPDGPGEGAV